MAITINQVEALTVKGIEAKGGVRDAIFKNHAYLSRLKDKQGVYSGQKMTFPFVYKDESNSTGRFYQGGETLSLDQYDHYTELSFDMIELEETLVITHRDIARNSGKHGALRLVAEKLKTAEMNMRQRFTKGIYSDGSNSGGSLNGKQFPGQAAFLKDSAVNYGGITSSDFSGHVSYINSNSGTDRALSTALWQDVYGGASEGEKQPTLAIMRQNVMNELVELLKPNQRTTRDSDLGGLGHGKNTIVYGGIDHIVDNLAIAQSISFLNEDHVRLYSHPEYDMKRIEKGDLETVDGMLQRLFWKGVYAADVLRFQGKLADIDVV